MRNKELRLVVDTFNYYYKSITKNESYRFKMSDNRKVLIENFIARFKAESSSMILQKDHLNLFMEFQFNYWYRKDAKYGKGTSIQVEWIIGNKAFKRWNDRTEKQKRATPYLVRKKLKSEVKLKKRTKDNEGWLKSFLEIKSWEEQEKEMFHDTFKGLTNCLINTTLYYHKSTWCSKCKNKMKCKAELRESHPIVYSKRGY